MFLVDNCDSDYCDHAVVLVGCSRRRARVEEPAGEITALPKDHLSCAGMYKTLVTMAGPFTDQDEVVFNDSIKLSKRQPVLIFNIPALRI